MQTMIATCGLTCTECPAYVATQRHDTEALERVARQWSDELGIPMTADECRCNGCHAKDGPQNVHCSECAIRACGAQRSVDNCALCEEFGCETLTAFIASIPIAQETLRRLRDARSP